MTTPSLRRYLDEPVERRSLIRGFLAGLYHLRPRPRTDGVDVEPDYYLFGYILAYLLKIQLVILYGPDVLSDAVMVP